MSARVWRADVAFLPGLGFGVTIQPGPITREMLLGLFPHPTSVVHEQRHGAPDPRGSRAERDESPAGERPRSGRRTHTDRGATLDVDLTKPLEHRIRDVSVGNQPLERTHLPGDDQWRHSSGDPPPNGIREWNKIVRDAEFIRGGARKGLRDVGTCVRRPLGRRRSRWCK